MAASALRIYFCGSIRGGRADRSLYEEIIRHLATRGKVLTEHIADADLEEVGEVRTPDAAQARPP